MDSQTDGLETPGGLANCVHAFIQVNGVHKTSSRRSRLLFATDCFKIVLSRFGTNYQQAGFPCQMLLEGFWAATHLPLHSPSSLTLEQHWVSMDSCAG